jgi:hypothetical protein
VADNMYNATYSVRSEQIPFKIVPDDAPSCLVLKIVIRLVASTALQVGWLPASVEFVVICTVATIADGRAITVLAVDFVIAALG